MVLPERYNESYTNPIPDASHDQLAGPRRDTPRTVNQRIPG